MAAYYNEVDHYAAGWLRNLVSAGLIPDGDVDERDIRNVQPEDVRGYTQCHFFAGIGGWAYAARLAGWPDDRPIWTGSCPCQGESVAGKRLGKDDPRHLWPDFFRLIRACRPSVVMGEQVARAAGTHWLDGVWSDMEGEDYAFRPVDIPACAVGAPHIRSRLWWVADRDGAGWHNGRCLEHANGAGWQGCAAFGRNDGEELAATERTDERHRPNGSWWAGAEWIACHDGKARRAEPGIPLLAHGIPNRVAKWRGFGNAVVPQVAAEVISAYMDIIA